MILLVVGYYVWYIGTVVCEKEAAIKQWLLTTTTELALLARTRLNQTCCTPYWRFYCTALQIS